jgi:RNA polymerase sigma-70 factor (ECF subfamily)
VAAKTYLENTHRAEGSTLTQARRGDRKAFSRLMEPYRRELVAYCYRHTGSLTEAEDLAQEAFLRAYRAMNSFEGRATARAWLYRIAHNLCINHAQRSRPTWESLASIADDKIAAPVGAAEDECGGREDVRLGFVALMRSMPPRQRAALVLRDVLGWSAEEAAQILGATVPAVKNALARARATLARRPGGSDPAGVHDLAAADAGARAMVAEWVDAFEKGNTERMVALLTGGDASAALHFTGRPPGSAEGTSTPGEQTDAEYIVRKRAGRRSPAPDVGNIKADTG